jgi:hypothetical protein
MMKFTPELFIASSLWPGGTRKRVRISGYELWQFDNTG